MCVFSPTFPSLGRGSWLHRSPFTPPIPKLVSAQTLYEDAGAVSGLPALDKIPRPGRGERMLTDRCRGGPLNRASQEGRSVYGNMNPNAPNDPWLQVWSGFPHQQRVRAVTTEGRITVTRLFGGRTFEFLLNPSRKSENFKASRLIRSALGYNRFITALRF